MRKEIEVKAKVEDLESLIEELKKIGCEISPAVEQHDLTFVDEFYGPYEQFHPGKNILRIRESNGKFLFTLKQPQLNELDAVEHETEVADPESFKNALMMMGYKPIVEIHKKRRKANYKDTEICLNEVKELGNFVEVEKIGEDENALEIQEELFKFLETLGVNRENRVEHGYDTMIYLKSLEN